MFKNDFGISLMISPKKQTFLPKGLLYYVNKMNAVCQKVAKPKFSK